jgi:hypothetical protein
MLLEEQMIAVKVGSISDQRFRPLLLKNFARLKTLPQNTRL